MSEDVKVLIVDDEPRNLDALEVMLASSGCSLVRAHSADEALLAMLRHEFAAMIFDIRMPGMGGIELANLVKQRRRTQDVPIIFLTAHSTRGRRRAARLRRRRGRLPEQARQRRHPLLQGRRSSSTCTGRRARWPSLNEELQREVVARGRRRRRRCEQVNQELEVRVAERTAALTVAHRGVEGKRRAAQDGDGRARKSPPGSGTWRAAG